MTTKNPISEALDSYDFRSIAHEHDVLKVINAEGLPEVPERRLEATAFCLCENHGRATSVEWTGYFIPLLTGRDDQGNERPTVAEAVTADAISYWAERAVEPSSPFLRARYADLVWEFGSIAGIKQRGRFAILAMAAFAEIGAEDSGFQIELRHRALARYLELARSLNNAARLAEAADRIAEDGSSEARRQPFWAASLLAANGEARLVARELSDRLDASMVKLIQEARESERILRPALILDWVHRLLDYRAARKDSPDESRRMVRELADELLANRGSMEGLIALHAMQGIRTLALSVGLDAEMGAIDAAILEEGRRAGDGMSELSVPFEIPKEEFDRFIAWALGADFDRSFIRALIGPLPRRTKLESVADVCVGTFESCVSTTTVTGDGRPGSVSAGGGLQSRRFQRARSICLGLARVFTGFALRELSKRGLLSVRTMARTLSEYSPAFMADPITNRAIAHAFRHKRWPVATTLLVLRIEPLLLALGQAKQVRSLRPNAAGGLNTTSTEALIEDAEMRAAMGEQLAILLDHVFEPQGLRHSIAHGQRRDDQFSEDDAVTALQAVVGLSAAIARAVGSPPTASPAGSPGPTGAGAVAEGTGGR